MFKRSLFLGLVMLVFSGCIDEVQQLSPKEAYLRDLEQKCNMGNMGYCVELAENIVKKDSKRATMLYDRACSGGYVKACMLAGDLFYEGQVVKQSLKDAKMFYERACDLGSTAGCREFKHLNK